MCCLRVNCVYTHTHTPSADSRLTQAILLLIKDQLTSYTSRDLLGCVGCRGGEIRTPWQTLNGQKNQSMKKGPCVGFRPLKLLGLWKTNTWAGWVVWGWGVKKHRISFRGPPIDKVMWEVLQNDPAPKACSLQPQLHVCTKLNTAACSQSAF